MHSSTLLRSRFFLRVPPDRPAARPSAVFLPKEHGSWSLALEPVLLGLIVAPSAGGTALATAAFAGFFARRPLKALLATENAARRPAARAAFILLASLALTALSLSVLLGGLPALWPLLVAAPLGGLFVYFDSKNEARAAAAEVAGSAAFAFVPAALATLAGWSGPAALALALIALARSVPAVLTVRAYLRRAKGAAPAFPWAAWSATLAVVGLGFSLSRHLVPETSVLLATLLLGRTLWLTSPLAPAWPARRVGQLEAILGLLYVGAVAVAYRLT